MFLFDHGYECKKRKSVRLEPLPRWIVPCSFTALLDLLSQCGVCLEASFYCHNFFTAVLCQRAFAISQAEVKMLLDFLVPRGFPVQAPANFLLLAVFSRAFNSDICQEDVTPTTVEIIKMLIPRTQAQLVQEEYNMTNRIIMDGIIKMGNIFSILLSNMLKKLNSHAVEIATLFIERGYGDEEAERFFCNYRAYYACFRSAENLQNLMKISQLFEQRLPQASREKFSTFPCLWRAYTAYYKPPKTQVSLVDFVEIVVEMDMVVFPYANSTPGYWLIQICKHCIDDSLPEVVRMLIVKYLNGSKSFNFDANAALVALGNNEMRRVKVVHDAVRELVAANVRYAEHSVENALVVFLAMEHPRRDEDKCCKAHWFKYEGSPYWDTLRLLLEAGFKISMPENRDLFFRVLSRFCTQCWTCESCMQLFPQKRSARLELFTNFLRFVDKLLEHGVAWEDGKEGDWKGFTAYISAKYSGLERRAVKFVLSQRMKSANK